MAKFTFKKDPKPTGLAAIGHTPGVDIKYKGKVVGRIEAPQWSSKDRLYRVRFTCLKTEDQLAEKPNCKWQWRTSRKAHESEQAARDWLKSINADELVEAWRIVPYEDY